jgi:hypothetical protein
MIGATLPTENAPRRRGGLAFLIQRFDPRDQQVVVTQLSVAAHGPHHLMLAREAAVPVNRNVHMFAAWFDIHDDLVH